MAQQVKNLPAMQDIKSYPRPPVWGLVPRAQKWSPESRSSLKLTEPLWNWLSPSVTVVKRPLKVTNKLSDSQLSKMPTPASTIYHPGHHLTPTFHQEFSLSWDYYGYYPPKFVGFPWYVRLALSTHTEYGLYNSARVQLQQPGNQPEGMSGVGREWCSLWLKVWDYMFISSFRFSFILWRKHRSEVWHFQSPPPTTQIYCLQKSLLPFKQSSCFSESLRICFTI